MCGAGEGGGGVVRKRGPDETNSRFNLSQTLLSPAESKRFVFKLSFYFPTKIVPCLNNLQRR